jgi:hypothetical protein
MSFGAVSTPVAEKKLANITGADTSSNQQAIPVPYFAGTAKIPLGWISPFYNITAKNVASPGAKKGAGGASTQKNWYADIAGVACVCPDDAPVDAVLYVLVNDEIAFTGPLNRSGGAHYAALTLLTYCQEARCYWGTKNSPIDTLILLPRGVPPVGGGFDARNSDTFPCFDIDGNPIDCALLNPGVAHPQSGHYDLHPAYRNCCYFVFKQFFLGGSPNMPNVTVILRRGTKFFSGARFEATAQGVNPMGPLFELITDDLAGAGLPEAELDSASWIATATALTAAGILLNPLLTSATSLRSFVATYMQYFDGFLRRNGLLLEAGYFSHGAFDTSGLITLASDDLASEPQINPGTLEDTKNQFTVAFANRETWYFDDTAIYTDLSNFNTVGELRQDFLPRPFINDATLAQRYIIEWGQMNAKIGGAGAITALREKVASLLPGSRFVLDSTSFGLEMLLRVTALEWPADKDAITKLSISVERADWQHLYIQPPVPKDPDFSIIANSITVQKVIELPSPLKDENNLEIAILAQRPGSPIIGFRTYLSLDNITYNPIDQSTFFAVRGKIKVENYPATTPIVDDVTGMRVALYGPDLATIVSQSNQQRDDHTLLVWVGNEIMSIGTVTALGSGQYRVFPKRGCYGSSEAAHLIDDDCWFVFRANIKPIPNINFLPAALVYFKLQSYSATENYDLSLVTPISYFFNDGPFLLNNLELFGQGDDRTFTGRNPRFSWDLYDISGLGIISTPVVAPAVFNSATGLWYNLLAVSVGDDIGMSGLSGGASGVTISLATVGSAIAPITGAPAVFDAATSLWYALTASGAAGEMLIQLSDTGSGTPPAGGVPIIFNAATNLYYRVTASGTGTEITFGFDASAGIPGGAGNLGGWSDQFVRFDLRVRDSVYEDTVWTGTSQIAERIFGFEENSAAQSAIHSTRGPYRDFYFGVSVVARLQDGSFVSSPWLELEFNNPESLNPGGTVSAGFDHLDFVIPPSTDLDFAGHLLWRSKDDPAFVVTEPLNPGVELIHDGPENSYSVQQDEGVTWYYRSSSYDAFGKQLADLDISPVVPFTTQTLTPTLPPPSISPGSQNFTGTLLSSVLAPDPADTIRFTQDGTGVRPNSQEWPGGIGAYTTFPVTRSCMIRARYYTPDGTPSQEVIVVYTLDGTGGTCGAVSIAFSGRQGRTSGTIVLTCATPSSAIQYSLDGSGYVSYTGPFVLNLNQTVEAYATASGLADGPTSYFDNTAI